MTIYEIKKRTQKTSPMFFSRNNMKAAGQTLKSFTVVKMLDGRYLVTAPIKDFNGKVTGLTIRYFNPFNNRLEHR